MRIISPAFSDGESIPKDFTCEGYGLSPELHISEVPSNAVSLALIVEDPDAPNGIFTHWMIWGIDPRATIIPKGMKKQKGMMEGKNDLGEPGYLGPCPPKGHGLHHYHFKMYALNAPLTLLENATPEEFKKEVLARQADSAELVGTYSR